MRLGQNKNKKKEEKKKGNGFPVGLLFAALVLCGGVAYFVFQTSESEGNLLFSELFLGGNYLLVSTIDSFSSLLLPRRVHWNVNHKRRTY